MALSAVVIDNREPDWVQKLKFGGVPTSVQMLDAGDIMAATDNGAILLIERKTPNDFLNSLASGRMFVQIAKLVDARLKEQARGELLTTWPILLITGWFGTTRGGKVVTDRTTGWDFAAVNGALLSIQEMGAFVAYCAGDADFEKEVIRLGNRERTPIDLLPPRPPQILGPQAAVLTAFPGIGIDKAQAILEKTGTLDYALDWLTSERNHDFEIHGVNYGIRRNVRSVMGCAPGNKLAVTAV